MFFAEAAMAVSETSSWMQTLITAGTMAGGGALAIYLIKFQIPKMNSDAKEEREKAHTEAREEREKLRAEFKEERHAERATYLAALDKRDSRLDKLIDKHHEIVHRYHESAKEVAAALEANKNAVKETAGALEKVLGIIKEMKENGANNKRTE